MPYQLTLIDAKVRNAMDADITIGMNFNDNEVATVELSWNRNHFTSKFNGFAPELPEPAHPAVIVGKIVAAINENKATPEEPLSSLFARTSMTISL